MHGIEAVKLVVDENGDMDESQTLNKFVIRVAKQVVAKTSNMKWSGGSAVF